MNNYIMKWDEALERGFYKPLNDYTRGLCEEIQHTFLQAHPGSYLAMSTTWIPNRHQVIIEAPKYNMIGFLNGEKLEFDYNGSYANELDEDGSKIAVKKKKRVVYLKVGNWRNYVEEIAKKYEAKLQKEDNN